MSDDACHYVCDLCEDRFGPRLFSLNRSVQRFDYGAGGPLVHVADAIALTTCCSDGCQEVLTPYVMDDEDVPIPTHPPGSGPIEVCAVCQGSVDMSQPHLDYSVSEEAEQEPNVLMHVMERSIAVVCAGCAPQKSRGDAAAVQASEPERDVSIRLDG